MFGVGEAVKATLCILLACQPPTRIIVTPATPQITIEHRECGLPAVPRPPVLTVPVTEDSVAEIVRFEKAVTAWMAQVTECLAK